jgi:hypothetical protein
MKVEVQEPNLVLELTVIDLPDVLLSQNNLSGSRIRQQIHCVDRSICRDNVFHVFVEGTLGHFWTSCESHILSHTLLFPEDRD